MKWFKNLKISTKLGILTAASLAVLIFVAVFGYYNTNHTSERFIDSYEEYAKPAMNMAIARSNLQGNQKNVLKLILAEDSAQIAEVTADFARRREENAKIFSDYGRKRMDDTEKRLYAEAEKKRAHFYELQDRCLELGRTNQADEATKLFLDELDPAAQDYNHAVVELAGYLVDTAAREENAASAEAHRAAVTIVIVALVISLILGIFSYAIVRMIVRPIDIMNAKIGLFAEGDLSVSFASDGRDAVSRMGNALENMIGSLRRVVSTISDAGGKIAGASQEFSSLAEKTNASVEDFRTHVDEVSVNLSGLASASEEVNASVEEVAAGAQTTAEKGTDIARKVDDAMNAGNAGIKAVQSVVDGISRVAESSAASTTAVTDLGSRARQIQSFVTQIAGIADQTNLLALNAAIEAARAGEAGRGFAVVAEEVRKLAEDSNVAAKNIANLAATITSELDSIVKSAQENETDSKSARNLSSETKDAIDHMIGYLRDIASATQDLAAVAQEQAASSEEIAESVQGMSGKINDTAKAGEGIRSGVGEVSASSESMAKGAEELASLSESLEDELAFFKLPAGGRSTAALPVKNKRLASLSPQRR